jgi:hypothetical protein
VLDRPQLEARVCECYAVEKKEFDRLLGHFGAGTRTSQSSGAAL